MKTKQRANKHLTFNLHAKALQVIQKASCEQREDICSWCVTGRECCHWSSPGSPPCRCCSFRCNWHISVGSEENDRSHDPQVALFCWVGLTLSTFFPTVYLESFWIPPLKEVHSAFFHGDFTLFNSLRSAFPLSFFYREHFQHIMFFIMTHEEKKGALHDTLPDHPVFVDNRGKVNISHRWFWRTHCPLFTSQSASFPFIPLEKTLGSFSWSSPESVELFSLLPLTRKKKYRCPTTEIGNRKLPPPIIQKCQSHGPAFTQTYLVAVTY